MNMSLSNFSGYNDESWDKFVSTGNVYDYLEYRSKVNGARYNTNETTLTGDRGGFCENRSKRDSNQRG